MTYIYDGDSPERQAPILDLAEFIRRHDEVDLQKGMTLADDALPGEMMLQLQRAMVASVQESRDDIDRLRQEIIERQALLAKRIDSLAVTKYIVGERDTPPWVATQQKAA